MVIRKIVIIYLILISLILVDIASAKICDDKYYSIDIIYKDGKLVYDGEEILKGCYSNPVSRGDYELNLMDNNKEVVYSLKFDPTLRYTDGNIDGQPYGGADVVRDTKFTLNVPYTKDLEKIDIKHKGNIIINVPIEKEDLGGFFAWVNELMARTVGTLFSKSFS